MIAKAICNTGPIIALSMIDRIDILRHLFEFIAVPEAVHREILEGGATNIGPANYQKAKWIKVMRLSTPLDPLLITSLDAGEAAVIRLARELSVNIVVIDERKKCIAKWYRAGYRLFFYTRNFTWWARRKGFFR